MAEQSIERMAIVLFEEMLRVPEEHRQAWLHARTADNPQLRGRLDAMRVADRTASLRTGGAIDDAADDAPPPQRLGGYRLLDRIGRGGMGSVFAASRDLGDFAHTAAIKIIKPGLLSEALVDRFRRERQTLARLSHPNIARLFGGGETGEGAPFIIMELIDGVPLPAWIEHDRPSLNTRLALFEEACRAVAFAHANLIAHRDITPSNILVTRDGHAKLIDFGIARALDDDAAADHPPDALKSLILTPGYSAPERQSDEATTTLVDIYSLGRVLDRIMEPTELSPELRAIVTAATAIDPANRYPSANALADDIHAYRAGLPVSAYSTAKRYLVRKLVRRHRLAVASGLATVVALIAALALVITLYARAESARRAEIARFEQLRGLARFMVFDLNGRLERVVGNADARLALVERAQHYLVTLARTPNASPELRLDAARGLVALARIQGVPAQPNLGQYEAARGNLALAVAMLGRPDLDAAVATPVKVDALVSEAMLKLHQDANVAGGRADLDEAAAMLDSMALDDRRSPFLVARSTLRRGQLEWALVDQKPAEMVRLAALVDHETDQWPPALRHSPIAVFDRANADYHRGLNGYITENPKQAIIFFERAERRLIALDRARPNDPKTLYLLAWVQYTAYGTAISSDKARAARFLAGADHTITRLTAIEPKDRSLISFAANIGSAKAQLLSAQGRFGEAISEQRTVLVRYGEAVRAKPTPATRNRIAIAQLVLGNIYRQAGDRAAACLAYETSHRTLTVLKREKALLGFVGRFEDGLARNVALCARAAPIAAIAILE